MISQIIQSPVGPLKITVGDGFVTSLSFHWEHLLDSQQASRVPLSPAAQKAGLLPKDTRKDFNILQHTIKELDAYFDGQLRNFTVPVRLSGTPFQQKAWQAMRNIAYGETKTYRQLAQAAGSPKAARAIGNACAANPVAIIVPCHRVLAQSGLGGFGGGLDKKQFLLNLEGKARHSAWPPPSKTIMN